jgi:hypothetical protein
MRNIIQEKKENFGLEQRKSMRTDKFESIRSQFIKILGDSRSGEKEDSKFTECNITQIDKIVNALTQNKDDE